MNNGAFGEGFPYTNFHDLNMDWIIQIAKNFLDQYTNIQQTITEGLEGLDNKAQELEDLLQQWYDTHSSDIANQLASALSDLNNWYTTHEGYLDQYVASSIASFNQQAEQKAQQTIASIPADYTTLANNVTDLQTNVNVQGAVKDVTPEYTLTEEAFITNEGEIKTQRNYAYSNNIEVHAGEAIRVSMDGPNWLSALSVWTSDGTFVKSLLNGRGEYVYVPRKTEYVRFSTYVLNPHYFNVYKLNDFAFDNFLIKETKKELDNIAMVTNIYNDYEVFQGRWISSSTGAENSNPNYIASDYIPVTAGQKIEYKFHLASASNTSVALLGLYDSSKTYVTYISRSSANVTEYKGIYTVPTDGFVRFTNGVNLEYKINIASNDTGIFKAGTEFINEYNNTLIDGNYVMHYAYSMDNILCIGDSLTRGACYAYGFEGESIRENYPYYLGRMINTTTENAGYSGISTRNWYNNHSNDYNYNDYNIAFIWLGTNGGLTDTLATDVNPYTDYRNYADTNTGAYCKIIEKMRETNPDIQIVLLNLFTDSLQGESNTTIDKIATKYNLPIIDMKDLAVADHPELHGNISNIHFTKVGNMFLARRIITAMNSVWCSNPSSCDYGMHLL